MRADGESTEDVPAPSRSATTGRASTPLAASYPDFGIENMDQDFADRRSQIPSRLASIFGLNTSPDADNQPQHEESHSGMSDCQLSDRNGISSFTQHYIAPFYSPQCNESQCSNSKSSSLISSPTRQNPGIGWNNRSSRSRLAREIELDNGIKNQVSQRPCSPPMSNNNVPSYERFPTGWYHEKEFERLQNEAKAATKHEPEKRSLYHTASCGAFSSRNSYTSEDYNALPVITDTDTNFHLPSMLRSGLPIKVISDLATYMASASYMVSLGGTAAPDMRYGIIVVPAGDEELLLTASNDESVMSVDFRKRIYAKSKEMRIEENHIMFCQEWQERFLGGKWHMDDDDRKFYQKKWRERLQAEADEEEWSLHLPREDDSENRFNQCFGYWDAEPSDEEGLEEHDLTADNDGQICSTLQSPVDINESSSNTQDKPEEEVVDAASVVNSLQAASAMVSESGIESPQTDSVNPQKDIHVSDEANQLFQALLKASQQPTLRRRDKLKRLLFPKSAQHPSQAPESSYSDILRQVSKLSLAMADGKLAINPGIDSCVFSTAQQKVVGTV